jgi:hypothetical protein
MIETENTNTETAASVTAGNAAETAIAAGDGSDVSRNVDTEQEQATGKDEFGDADREKLSEVVKKERAAAKAQATRAEQAEKRLAELEANELRRTVAEEKGLSNEQAAFLTGDSAEEMAAAADALLAAFPTGSASRRGPFERALRSGATGETQPAESMDKIASRVLD